MVFKNYAYYYDLLYKEKDYSAEVKYIDKLIKKFSRNSKSILDLGCGTGSHDLFFANKGYNIFGVDYSSEMIKIGNKKLNKELREKITLKKGDVRKLNLKKKFDVVTLLFNVIGYQVKNEDLNATLRTANKHLKKSGIFIFDFWYGPAVLLDLPIVKAKKVENAEVVVTRLANPSIHFDSNCVDVNFKMSIKSKINQKEKKFFETHKVRYMFIPEMEDMLKNNGFRPVVFNEWMTFKKANYKTWYVCVVAEKI